MFRLMKKLGFKKSTSNVEGDESDALNASPVNGTRKGLSLRTKLLLMLISAGMTAVLAISYLGYKHGEQQLTETTVEQLTLLRRSKQQQIEFYFEKLNSSLVVLSSSTTVSSALSDFSKAFAKLGKQKDGKTIKDLSSSKKDLLETFYKSKFFPKIDEFTNGKSNIEIFWPRTVEGRLAQSAYISENPFKINRKFSLSSSPNDTPYDKVHKDYHSYFLSSIAELKFDDLYLIEGEKGHIVYSAHKRTDFGTGLIKGPYSHTSLGRLYNKIRESPRRGFVFMEDFTLYPPSYLAPAAFVGTAVIGRDGTFQGVLAVQLSSDEINHIMTNSNEWVKDGLGKSGEVYLVGDDSLMRSNSRFLIEDKKAYLKVLLRTHITKSALKRIDHFNTSVLMQPVKTVSVTEAFLGERNTKVVKDYRGIRVLSSYAPLDLPGLRWAVLAEIDEEEARAPQLSYTRNVLLTAGAMLLLLTLGSLLLASKFLKPISVLIDGVGRIRKGEKNVKIDKLANDEFGELSDTFNVMTSEIERRDELIEQQSTSYDSLLNRIYPANIVERLKKGEGKIADSLHQVSVVYMILHGYSKQTESMDSLEALDLLNELVDSMDTTCETFGVEKVKTIGEHYLAVCGLSVPRLDHARRALDFCHAASRELAIFNARYDMSLTLRVGIHSGPLKAGIVGSHNFDFDVWGNSLNIARRIVFEADLNSVRITTHTYHMLNTTDDFGPELIVDTKVVGEVSTFQQSLDTTLDENRLDSRKRGKRKSSGNGDKADKKSTDEKTDDKPKASKISKKASDDSSKAAE